jgi:Uma2 family endonuclease
MNVSLLEPAAPAQRPAVERLTVGQFHQMMEHGILPEGAPVELLDGMLIRKDRSDAGGDPTMHGRRHALCVKKFVRLAPRAEAQGCHLQFQLPVTLSEFYEPEPDVAAVRGEPEDYDPHPGPTDIFAVVEIADSSLAFDRDAKGSMYAAVEIPVYWVVNIPDRVIEVYELPNRDERRYERMTAFREGDTVHLPLGSGQALEVGVAELLP